MSKISGMTKGVGMISFTKHALERMKERYPSWTDQNCMDMARLAISCGKLLPGHNGCRRYQFLNKEFVINENNGNPVVITVY